MAGTECAAAVAPQEEPKLETTPITSTVKPTLVEMVPKEEPVVSTTHVSKEEPKVVAAAVSPQEEPKLNMAPTALKEEQMSEADPNAPKAEPKGKFAPNDEIQVETTPMEEPNVDCTASCS